MGKTVDNLVQNIIETNEFTGVLLAKLHFNPEQRYTNAYQNIYWDEDGSGEQEYIGLGNLANISIITETSDLSAQTVQLSLSGIPNDMITDIYSNDYIGKPAYIWYATLDPDTYAVQFESPNTAEDGPILIFAGLMDFGTIEFGETATITVNVTSRLADWERARGGRFNHAHQQTYVDANDLGFEYVEGLQDKPIGWGGIVIADPGTNPGVHPSDEACRYCCFTPDTFITMADGSIQSIDSIKVNDLIKVVNGVEKVTEVITRTNRTMYKIIFNDNRILNTSEDHPLFVEGKGFAAINPDLTIDYKDLGIAKQLNINDNVVTINKNTIKIVKIEPINYIDTVYTFKNSQFFANGILVY